MSMASVARTAVHHFFQDSLAEVVRKMRNASEKNEPASMERFLVATEEEIASPVPTVKAVAVQKAVYFSMLGYPVAFAHFPVVEIMCSTNFALKRTGYMAACLLFNEQTDVLPLITALLKRDLRSSNMYEAGLALYCIASICTPDLAKDLITDIVHLLNHTRNYLRKKAVLCLYKVFLQYPDSLRPVYPKLKEKLEDSSDRADTDPAVRGAIVCVLCEVARRHPANFVGLAVPFFSLLNSVHSNWTLIKIVKVFGYLAPCEPRLGKKLAEPLQRLITKTGAKSVQYECLHAVANGFMGVSTLVSTTVDVLQQYVADADQNLKFLGLDALARIAQVQPSRISNKLLLQVRECVKDADTTIRRKALLLLCSTITKDNVVPTVSFMADQCTSGSSTDEWGNTCIAAIISMARTDDYALIEDFEWYVEVLVDLCTATFANYRHGELLEEELVLLLLRVAGIRPFAIPLLAGLMSHPQLLHSNSTQQMHVRSNQWAILRAAAFACGEYPQHLHAPAEAAETLLSTALATLPESVLLASTQAVSRIVAYLENPAPRHMQDAGAEGDVEAEQDGEEATAGESANAEKREAALQELRQRWIHDGLNAVRGSGLDHALRNISPQVQLWAAIVRSQLLTNQDFASQLYALPLQHVASGAQKAVVLPDGVDLDTPFCSAALTLASGSSDGEEEEEDDEDDVAMSFEARIEWQKQRDLERREEVSAFYLTDSSATAAPGTTDAVETAAKVVEVAEPPTLPRRRTRREEGTSTGVNLPAKKKFVMSRALVMPDGVAEAQPAATNARAGLSALLGEGAAMEEDEATRKLRGIDVNRALREDEQRFVDAMAEPAPTHFSAGISRSTAAALADAVDVDVELCHSKGIQGSAHIKSAKLQADGSTLVKGFIAIRNTHATAVMSDVILELATDASPIQFELTEADRRCTNDGEDADTAPRQRWLLAEHLNGGVLERASFQLHLTTSHSLMDPIAMKLQFQRSSSSRTTTVPATLQLSYRHFAQPSATLRGAPALDELLCTALRTATLMACFYSCNADTATRVNATLEKTLHLHPVEVFKEAITLYGRRAASSKAPADELHLALLLRLDEEEGQKGLRAHVMAHDAAFAEALLVELGELVEAADDAPPHAGADDVATSKKRKPRKKF